MLQMFQFDASRSLTKGPLLRRRYDVFVHNRFMLDSLMQNILNAPSLQSLTLCDTPVKLNDLEHIHNSLPELQEIILEDDEQSFHQSEQIDQQLVPMFSHMKDISSYLVGLCPLSGNVLHIMDQNGVELKEAKLVSLQAEQVPQIFELIQLSRPASTLENLAVDFHGVDITVMGRAFISMANNLVHLTMLRIDTIKGVSLVADIFQNLMALEKLVIHDLYVRPADDEGNDNYFDSIISKPYRIKYLKITMWFSGVSRDRMDKINGIFDCILQSCPLLQEVLLMGVISLPQLGRAQPLEHLNLDLRQNPQMKRLVIGIRDCSHYIINKTGELWELYHGNEGSRIDLSRQDYSTFYINLNWVSPVLLQLKNGRISRRPAPQFIQEEI